MINSDKEIHIFNEKNSYCWRPVTPEEIDKSAVVKCSFIKIFSQDPKKETAWIQVKIMDVIPLYELCNRFPAERCDKYFDLFNNADNKYFSKIEYGNWIYYIINYEGDWGYMALVYKHNSGSKHMVLYGEWHFHFSNAFCGNIISNEYIVRNIGV